MNLWGDYHTHTYYSDGKSSLEDNVKSAINKGLKQLAITDHSFSHIAHGITREKYDEQTIKINELKDKYKDIEILHGVETNLMSLDGHIDVKKEERNKFDILVMGYHYSYKPMGIKNFFNFWLPGVLNIKTKRLKRLNTMAYINAIKNNDIDIVAHLNYGIEVDPVEIAKVAKEHGVYIELNAKHLGFTDEVMKEMVKTGVKFIIDSDAHLCDNIGRNNTAYAMITRLNIPLEQIVNINNIPRFKNYNLDKNY